MKTAILSFLFGVSLLSGALTAPLSNMFEGRHIFESIMGAYRYRKADGWAHTADIADNFKGVDFYKDFVEDGDDILVQTAVSMKTTITKDVKAWLASEPIKKNIQFLSDGMANTTEGLTSNNKFMFITSAEIHIYMPKDNLTNDLFDTWHKELLNVTNATGIKFEIRKLEDFLK